MFIKAERIKLREQAIVLRKIGWTQQAIADHIGVPRTRLSYWLSRDMKTLPKELVESTRKHFGGKELVWRTEGELVSEILTEGDTFPYAYSYPECLWMLIKSNWDVFSNVGAYDEWWRIGNLRTDPVAAILARFRGNDCPGLHTIHAVSPRYLADKHGDPTGERIYTNKDDLLGLYVGRYCKEITISSSRRGRPRG